MFCIHCGKPIDENTMLNCLACGMKLYTQNTLTYWRVDPAPPVEKPTLTTVCVHCGAFVPDPSTGVCPRCGKQLYPDETAPQEGAPEPIYRPGGRRPGETNDTPTEPTTPGQQVNNETYGPHLPPGWQPPSQQVPGETYGPHLPPGWQPPSQQVPGETYGPHLPPGWQPPGQQVSGETYGPHLPPGWQPPGQQVYDQPIGPQLPGQQVYDQPIGPQLPKKPLSKRAKALIAGLGAIAAIGVIALILPGLMGDSPLVPPSVGEVFSDLGDGLGGLGSGLGGLGGGGNAALDYNSQAVNLYDRLFVSGNKLLLRSDIYEIDGTELKSIAEVDYATGGSYVMNSYLYQVIDGQKIEGNKIVDTGEGGLIVKYAMKDGERVAVSEEAIGYCSLFGDGKNLYGYNKNHPDMLYSIDPDDLTFTTISVEGYTVNSVFARDGLLYFSDGITSHFESSGFYTLDPATGVITPLLLEQPDVLQSFRSGFGMDEAGNLYFLANGPEGLVRFNGGPFDGRYFTNISIFMLPAGGGEPQRIFDATTIPAIESFENFSQTSSLSNLMVYGDYLYFFPPFYYDSSGNEVFPDLARVKLDGTGLEMIRLSVDSEIGSSFNIAGEWAFFDVAVAHLSDSGIDRIYKPSSGISAAKVEEVDRFWSDWE